MPKSYYRSLHISDIHMSNSLPFAKPWKNGVTDRLHDQERLWTRVFSVAQRLKCEDIFIQGDLFDHSRVDAITLTSTVEALAKAPVDVWLIAGNHDGVNTRGERFTVEALDGVGRCRYLPSGHVLQAKPWLFFWPLEYAPLARTRELVSRFKLAPNVTNVLLMHNSIAGCTHGGWTCEDDQGLKSIELTERFTYVLSGHFHDPQTFGSHGRYLGAPMHHHMGDVGRAAGFWVMEWRRDGTRKEQFVDGGAPRFHVVDFDDKAAIEIMRPNEGDYVRVKIRCTHAELQTKKPALEALVSQMKDDKLRASWMHDPVYQHGRRIEPHESANGVISMRKMIPAYVEAAQVDTSGFDRKALRRLGSEIFVAAEAQWRDS